MSDKKRVTIRDVAQRAGVSPTAVSFAFNSPEQLSQTTCQRILDVAARMHYQPHPVARTLATGRTDTIGLVLPSSLHWTLQDPFFRHFIGEFGALCDEHRLHILLVPAWTDTGSNTLNTIAADGFLIIGINREHPLSWAAEQSNRPVVLLDSERSISAPHIMLDDFRGAYLAAMHLIAQGHARLAVSSMRLTPSRLKAIPFATRLEGYKQAAADAGLPPDALQIVYTEESFQVEDPVPFADIWSLPVRPSAVLCVSDTRALHIVRAARTAGVDVPGDLAVVGFDNIPEAATATPPLTTIDQQISARCRHAFDLLHRLIDDPTDIDAATTMSIDPVSLIVRESG